MIKVMFYAQPLHQLEQELTLLEKAGQQVVSVTVAAEPLNNAAMAYHGMTSHGTTGSNPRWWVTVRLPDDKEAVDAGTFEAGVTACAEHLEKKAMGMRDEKFLARHASEWALELRRLSG
jgi:hypothetical protein